MNVAFFSKAMVSAAYRDRIDALRAHCRVELVLPARWGRSRPEAPVAAESGRAAVLPVIMSGHNHLHLYRRAAVLLDRLRPDLVHIDEEPYSAVTLQLALQCRRRRRPFLFFAWQNLHKRLPPPFALLRQQVFRMAAGAIAGTPAAAAVLRAAGFAGPLAIIPQMGVDPERFRSDPPARDEIRARVGVRPGEQLVGFGGRLVREKGVDLLLQAASSLPHVRVLVLGDGPERRALVELAHALGIAGRVFFAGHVDSIAMARWLGALDVLVLPSRSTRGWTEQFGRVLVEAMASGVPVIAARSGEIPHVVGDAGVLVPEDDSPALAAALARLACDPAHRAALALAGRSRVLERFTNAGIAAETAAFYRRLLPAARERVPVGAHG